MTGLWVFGRPTRVPDNDGALRGTCDAGGLFQTPAGLCRRVSAFDQSSRSAGTLPPFSARAFSKALCSQMFMLAESFLSPV